MNKDDIVVYIENNLKLGYKKKNLIDNFKDEYLKHDFLNILKNYPENELSIKYNNWNNGLIAYLVLVLILLVLQSLWAIISLNLIGLFFYILTIVPLVIGLKFIRKKLYYGYTILAAITFVILIDSISYGLFAYKFGGLIFLPILILSAFIQYKLFPDRRRGIYEKIDVKK